MTTLSRLRKLVEEATARPWSRSWLYGGLRHLNRNVDYDAFWMPNDEEDENTANIPHKEDAGLIVAAVNALPSLIACAENLSEVLEIGCWRQDPGTEDWICKWCQQKKVPGSITNIGHAEDCSYMAARAALAQLENQ